MSTIINKTNSTVLVEIPDGGVDTSASDLALIGRLYRNYGELVNENFVKLLENFAKSDAPAQPLEGQLWYDAANKDIKVYRDSGFAPLSVLSSGGNEPSSPVLGDQWWDTVDAQLKLYNGSSWIVVSPGYTTSQEISGAIVENIRDVSSVEHVITKIYAGGELIAIFSKDNEFVPISSLVGFSSIKPGLNIAFGLGFEINGNIAGYTSTSELQSLVAASTDFANFQARIAAL